MDEAAQPRVLSISLNLFIFFDAGYASLMAKFRGR